MPFTYAGYLNPDSYTNAAGRPIPGASLTFYLPGSNTLATLYSNETKTQSLANPVTVDANGNLPGVYAEPGFYEYVATVSGVAQSRVKVQIPVHPSDLGDSGLSSHVAAADPHTAAGYGRKGIANTWTGAQTFDTSVTFKGPRPWADVRAFGAVGDGVTDDTAAIQAAINSLVVGDFIRGKVLFPRGTYKISAPLTVGDGSKYVSIEIAGVGQYWTSQATTQLVRIEPTSANINAFELRAPNNRSHSFVLRDLCVYYASVGTGHGIHVTGHQMNGLHLERVAVERAGVGFYNNAVLIYPVYRDCTAIGGTTGWHFNATSNVIRLEGCVAQANVVGIRFDEHAYSDLRTASCTIQANSSYGVYITGGGYVRGWSSNGDWWEVPGNAMICVDGTPGSGFKLEAATFIGTRFDGSNATGGRDVLRNAAAAASGVQCRNLTFIGCAFLNLNGGYLTTATNGTPSGSSQPGFISLAFFNCNGGGPIHGVHPTATQPSNMVVLSSFGLNASNFVDTPVPNYVVLSGGGNTRFSTPTVQIDGSLWLGGAGTLTSGSGAPTAAATDGDYYFRTDTPGIANQRIYVRSGGAWVGIV